MKYRQFGKTGERVSVLGLGTMRLPVINNQTWNIDATRATEMALAAIEGGVNYIDTAFPYHGKEVKKGGASEPFVGDFVKKHKLRDKVRIATKMPTWLVETRQDMDRLIETQLKRLKTDYIDFYLLHTLNPLYWEKYKRLDVFDFIEKNKKAGRVKHIGFSYHYKEDALAAIIDQFEGLDFIQVQYNYVDLSYQGGRLGAEKAGQKNLGLAIMEPLKGGFLANRLPEVIKGRFERAPGGISAAELALKWLWNQPEVGVVLSGMSTLEQVKQNLRYAEKAAAGALNAKEKAFCEDIRGLILEKQGIACTDCKYCLPNCPVEIDIPNNFAHYNDLSFALGSHPVLDRRLFSKYALPFIHYDRMKANQKSSSCVQCQSCLESCPQMLDIPTELEKVAKTFAPVAGG